MISTPSAISATAAHVSIPPGFGCLLVLLRLWLHCACPMVAAG
jgi:hypothetical protein